MNRSHRIAVTCGSILDLCVRLRDRLKREADLEIQNAEHRLKGTQSDFDKGTMKGAYWCAKHIAEVDIAEWLSREWGDVEVPSPEAIAARAPGYIAQVHQAVQSGAPIPMLLTCPVCGERHLDEGEFAHKPHHTHACQHCGMCWRPAIVPTVGVQFLPGFKNEES